MTNNTTATAPAATAELVHADPATLVIDDNVRTDTAIDAAFVASIATGVRQPVYAIRDSEGVVKVRDGQRRTLAAREAGLATIPVYIVDADTVEADDTERTRRRIIDQVITNQDRKGLKGSEEATAVEQLKLTGLSATRIAKELHTTKKKVDAALATATSQTAKDAVDTANLTLEQGMILAGYDDDLDAVHELLEAAAEGRFEHKAAELAETAAARAALREGMAHWRNEGFHVSAVRPQYRSAWTELSELVHAETGERVSDEQFEDLTPEHVMAFVESDCDEIYVNAAGEQVAVASIDWSVQDEAPDVAVAEGMADPRTLTEGEEWNHYVTWYHNDPARDGLETLSEYRKRTRAAAADADQPGAAPAGVAEVQDDGESPEDRADRLARERAERERKQAEEEKRERRKVLTLNKLGVAAQNVRREKLTEAFARKTLPKGKAAVVAAFLATTVWRNADLYNAARQDADAKKIAAELLGADPLEALDGAAAERAQLIALAITCAAHEANLPKDAWRGGHAYLRTVGDARTRYLRFLTETFGYALSDIEKVVTGDITTAEIDIS